MVTVQNKRNMSQRVVVYTQDTERKQEQNSEWVETSRVRVGTGSRGCSGVLNGDRPEKLGMPTGAGCDIVAGDRCRFLPASPVAWLSLHFARLAGRMPPETQGVSTDGHSTPAGHIAVHSTAHHPADNVRYRPRYDRPTATSSTGIPADSMTSPAPWISRVLVAKCAVHQESLVEPNSNASHVPFLSAGYKEGCQETSPCPFARASQPPASP